MRHTNRELVRSLDGMTKLTTLTCCFVAAGAVALGAQSLDGTRTRTKVEVKDGKDVKVTGCVEAHALGGYILTNVADKSGALHRYMLVSDSEDFAKQVGNRVQIEGKATDRDHGKVEITSESKTPGVEHDTHTKFEASGDLSGMPYLGVEHMKMIAASCP
jgi:hypothetical protein